MLDNPNARRGGDIFQQDWIDACKGKQNNVVNGTSTKTNRPTSVATNFFALAAGNGHSLALKGDGTLTAEKVAELVAALNKAVKVAEPVAAPSHSEKLNMC